MSAGLALGESYLSLCTFCNAGRCATRHLIRCTAPLLHFADLDKVTNRLHLRVKTVAGHEFLVRPGRFGHEDVHRDLLISAEIQREFFELLVQGVNCSDVLSGCSVLWLQNAAATVPRLLAYDFARCKVCDKLLFNCVQVDRGFRTYGTCELIELCQCSSFKAAVPVSILVPPCGDIVANHTFFNH
jgi:hypothetical protein